MSASSRPLTARVEAVERIALPGGVRLNYVQGGPGGRPRRADAARHHRFVVLVQPRAAAAAARTSDSSRSISAGTATRIDRARLHDGRFRRPMRCSCSTRCGVNDAVVVGHSMGSFVARRMAERAPDRVLRLVLVGTALSPQKRRHRGADDGVRSLAGSGERRRSCASSR